MRSREEQHSGSPSSSCAAAASEEDRRAQETEWEEYAENLKRKKKQAGEAEQMAKRQTVDIEDGKVENETEVGELDAIVDADEWEQWGQR